MAARTNYQIVGRYMDGSEVTGYHLMDISTGKNRRYSREQLAFLVGKGQVTNCSGQIYQDKLLLRGVGFENERHMIGIENEDLRITVTQIAGILARRIVSWVTLNDGLSKGELYGMIRFGSCTEVVVPKNVELLVKKGDKVVGGETIIGRIKE